MKKNIFVILALAYVFSLSACSSSDKNDDDITNQESDNQYVNDWIYENMKRDYYWNNHVPAGVDRKQSPDDYFYKILYKYKEQDGDRFSWIQENYLDLLAGLSGVSSGDIGFEFVLQGYSNSEEVWGEVLYVKPGTSAQAKGVKRGDVFIEINGTAMNMTNYSSLLNENSPTITFYDAAVSGGTLNLSNARNISLTKTNYAENPILLDSVYNVNGKKVGYLVYNFFSRDKGDNSESYDSELNSIFGKFKSAGINNLVVDLRYNSGGSILSAARLASMIVSNLNANNTFYILKYNSNYGQEYGKFESNINRTSINNVGGALENVCFITSSWSASASEMLINGLKPYMSNISIVGDVTTGKSFASITYYKENDSRNKWGIQPLIAFFLNSQGAEVPSTGIVPDISMREYGYIPKKQLGNTQEELLNAALAKVTGAAVTQRARAAVTLNTSVVGTSVNKKVYSNKALLPNRETE